MVWVTFLVSAALIVFAATQLAKYGDIIAVRTRLGGMFIGVLLLAGATSLPEVLTTISSLSQGVPNLAAGSLLGSNLFNMLLLAFLDLMHRKDRILRKAALKHALTGSLTVFLIGLVVFFMLADIKLQIGWVGFDGVVILLMYMMSVRLIHINQTRGASQPKEKVEIPDGTPALWKGLVGFGLAALGLVIVTPGWCAPALRLRRSPGWDNLRWHDAGCHRHFLAEQDDACCNQAGRRRYGHWQPVGSNLFICSPLA
jgi:cation:H+ antiporter